jgi:hypothetical protein
MKRVKGKGEFPSERKGPNIDVKETYRIAFAALAPAVGLIMVSHGSPQELKKIEGKWEKRG